MVTFWVEASKLRILQQSAPLNAIRPEPFPGWLRFNFRLGLHLINLGQLYLFIPIHIKTKKTIAILRIICYGNKCMSGSTLGGSANG